MSDASNIFVIVFGVIFVFCIFNRKFNFYFIAGLCSIVGIAGEIFLIYSLIKYSGIGSPILPIAWAVIPVGSIWLIVDRIKNKK